MTDDEPGAFKLGQYPIHRRQPNVLAGVAQTLIQILGTEVIALP